ncbi:hypothetical protein [Cytobacillus oceanisediminis]|uniref:hypothetical protein n=1 Tax=Cytobacillus oceanisediminis TaxID=665099 RepID=UPI00203E90BB|nr:hypothetical protein [Cytobacillus oceanisediminis]MCM3405453.1 hypothetical protein [Cytobacillus oceanisediminis]
MNNPFTGIKTFLDGMFSDVLSTSITIFGIGFLFCALMVWRGSEEHTPRFQKALGWTGAAVAVSALAKIIVTYVKDGVTTTKTANFIFLFFS